MPRKLFPVLALACVLLTSAGALAQSSWPQLELVFVGTTPFITHINHAGDGSGRLFLLDRRGEIRILRDGVILDTSFLDIRDRVLSSNSTGDERGLLSITFPPNYATGGYFYVYYSARDPFQQITVSRFYRSAEDPDIADPNSEAILLTIPHPTFSNHNGGQLAFGPDGYLYIGTGDGGGGGDPFQSGQNPGTYLAKVLRIDVESGEAPYGIPPTNPYVGVEGYLPEIWAWGLRNPWRFSFDTATGDLYIADVGQNRREEVNFQPASSLGGENYGWNQVEGDICYIADCDPSFYTPPVFAYVNPALGQSVTGGHVYRGADYPDMQGIYFFADYGSRRLWGIRYTGEAWESNLFMQTGLNISTFGQDEAGNLYVAGLNNGFYRVTSVASKGGGEEEE